MTDSYIVFTLKMESLSRITIFGLKMMVKSGLEIFYWNSSMRKSFSYNSFYLLLLRKITNSATKITIFLHGRKSKIFFAICTWPNSPVKTKFMSRFRVKTMYESVSQVRHVNSACKSVSYSYPSGLIFFFSSS